MTWARKLSEHRERRAAEREANMRALAIPPRTLHKGTYTGTTTGPAPKSQPVRSEAYRRLVAALPCSCGCGRRPCQAAHPNTGKGMGTKTDDRLCFPLAPECHRAFDQGAMFSKDVRRVMEAVWGATTRAAITAAGEWPKNLPPITEEP